MALSLSKLYKDPPDTPRRRKGDRYPRASNRLLTWIVILLGASSLWGLVKQYRDASNDESRDAARQYQRCVQTQDLIKSVNALILRGNRLINVRREDIAPVPTPNCAKTYPKGKKASPKFPDVAPTSFPVP